MGEENIVYFFTGNKKKYEEVKKIVESGTNGRWKVEQIKYSFLEMQTKSLKDVALKKCFDALLFLKQNDLEGICMVDDSGLFIKALKGFPGVYSSYIMDCIGQEGILKLMENEKNREAYFQCIIAIGNSITDEIKLFEGKCDGKIGHVVTSHSFGFDGIFIPRGYSKTFGEDKEIKDKVSHRRKALNEAIKYLNHLKF